MIRPGVHVQSPETSVRPHRPSLRLGLVCADNVPAPTPDESPVATVAEHTAPVSESAPTGASSDGRSNDGGDGKILTRSTSYENMK